MRWLQRALVGTLATAITIYSGNVGYRVGVNKPLQEYVRHRSKTIIDTQKKLMVHERRIKLPQIEFIVGSNSKDILGSYDPYNETIYLYSNLLISPDNNLENLIIQIIRRKKVSIVDQTLTHEMGHHLTNAISELFGHGTLPYLEEPTWENPNIPSEANLSKKLVYEGIAVYFERALTHQQDNFKDADWPKSLFDYRYLTEGEHNYIFYSGGYHLVKPIIDRYKEYGIINLIRELPSVEELIKPTRYQERILKDLEDMHGEKSIN